MRLKILWLLLLFSVYGIAQDSKEQKLKNYNIPLRTLLQEQHLPENRLNIIIDKSDYKLSVICDGLVLKEYPVVFGGNPIDDKLRQGDECTPEGNFKMRSKYPHKSWSKFIWIDYPNEASWKKHNNAKQTGKIPRNAKIGGEIGIHGVPDNADWLIDLRKNWTLGCISLKNKDINEIYPIFSKNTEIIIRK